MLLKSSKLAVAAAFVASAAMGAPTTAQAGWRPYQGYYGYPAPAYYGYGQPYGYPVYKKRRSNRGAIAAALIGGIALGAILASTQRGYARSCVVNRRAYTRSGRPFVRRVRVC